MNHIKDFFTLLSLLLLFFNTIDARKDLGEYWRGVMKDQEMPESIRRLIPIDPEASKAVSIGKADCHTSVDLEQKILKNRFVKNFEQNADVSIYDSVNKPTEKKFFIKDLELRPDVSIYDNDIKPNKQRSFVKNFDPKADVSIYDNDIKSTEQNSDVSNMESSPDSPVYHE